MEGENGYTPEELEEYDRQEAVLGVTETMLSAASNAAQAALDEAKKIMNLTADELEEIAEFFGESLREQSRSGGLDIDYRPLQKPEKP